VSTRTVDTEAILSRSAIGLVVERKDSFPLVLAREKVSKAAQPIPIRIVSELPPEQMLCLPITCPRKKNWCLSL